MWYYERDGLRTDPVDAAKIENLLREGLLDEMTMVRREGEPLWRHLDETDLVWILQGIRDEQSDENHDEGGGETEVFSPLDELIVKGERIWYFKVDEKVYGPVTTDELIAMHAQGEIHWETPVSEGDTEHWLTLKDTDPDNPGGENF